MEVSGGISVFLRVAVQIEHSDSFSGLWGVSVE
jgi:hypothetical protein